MRTFTDADIQQGRNFNYLGTVRKLQWFKGSKGLKVQLELEDFADHTWIGWPNPAQEWSYGFSPETTAKNYEAAPHIHEGDKVRIDFNKNAKAVGVHWLQNIRSPTLIERLKVHFLGRLERTR